MAYGLRQEAKGEMAQGTRQKAADLLNICHVPFSITQRTYAGGHMPYAKIKKSSFKN